jgi:hypothetical protein
MWSPVRLHGAPGIRRGDAADPAWSLPRREGPVEPPAVERGDGDSEGLHVRALPPMGRGLFGLRHRAALLLGVVPNQGAAGTGASGRKTVRADRPGETPGSQAAEGLQGEAR